MLLSVDTQDQKNLKKILETVITSYTKTLQKITPNTDAYDEIVSLRSTAVYLQTCLYNPRARECSRCGAPEAMIKPVQP